MQFDPILSRHVCGRRVGLLAFLVLLEAPVAHLCDKSLDDGYKKDEIAIIELLH